MRSLFLEYRPVLRFIGLFLGSYLFLTLVYQGYLSWSEGGSYQPDYITELVARQTSQLLTDFGYDAQVRSYPDYPSMILEVHGRPIAQVVEGCNAVSVIILFMAFVIAFGQGLRKTTLFIFVGAVLIYAINIFRIAFLTLALNKYPEYSGFLHDIVFPGIIYGFVLFLWLIWVRMLTPQTGSDHD